jgi:two-component system chemotaxis response regulator CheB
MRPDIIVIGASTGGFEALRVLLKELPPELPAAVFVVVHMAANGPGLLPQIIGRWTRLPARKAHDGERIAPGRIYVAPPDHHLLIKRGRVILSRGPRENRFRPAVDPLFRSAAKAYGARVVGVILSGGLDDGVAGLQSIKQEGGLAIVQEPSDAMEPSMPLSAIREVAVDEVLSSDRIGPRLVELVGSGAPSLAPEEPVVKDEDRSPDVAEFGSNTLERHSDPPSAFTCPECGGALWEVREGQVVRFRCHVGHGFSDDALAESQTDVVEEALWHALRALEENAALFRRMADRARAREMQVIASTYDERAGEVAGRAAVIRQVLVGGKGFDAEQRGADVQPE